MPVGSEYGAAGEPGGPGGALEGDGGGATRALAVTLPGRGVGGGGGAASSGSAGAGRPYTRGWGVDTCGGTGCSVGGVTRLATGTEALADTGLGSAPGARGCGTGGGPSGCGGPNSWPLEPKGPAPGTDAAPLGRGAEARAAGASSSTLNSPRPAPGSSGGGVPRLAPGTRTS
jgi:hypothetical protein